MSKRHQLGFFSVLRLGVKRLLAERDYNVSSYERLEEAFGRGVAAAKEMIARERTPEVFGRNLLPELARRAFPLSNISLNPDTKTLHVPITWQMSQPSLLDTSRESHFFLDNSGDSLRQLLSIAARVTSQGVPSQYVGLELLGDADRRPPSAILIGHGTTTKSLIEEICAHVDLEMGQERLGYGYDYLYPLARNHMFSHSFEPGEFRERRQAVFVALWECLFFEEILFLSQVNENFDRFSRLACAKLQRFL